MRYAVMVVGKVRHARRFARREDGQDLIEYGLLAALISIFAMTAVTTLGRTIYEVFWQTIGNNF